MFCVRKISNNNNNNNNTDHRRKHHANSNTVINRFWIGLLMNHVKLTNSIGR